MSKDRKAREEWKKAICQHYIRDVCIKGHHCTFAHGETDLQLYKTKTCMYHLDGRCTHGNNCKDAHSDSELRRQCKFHFGYKDGCEKGTKCPFSHDKGSSHGGDGAITEASEDIDSGWELAGRRLPKHAKNEDAGQY